MLRVGLYIFTCIFFIFMEKTLVSNMQYGVRTISNEAESSVFTRPGSNLGYCG